MDISDMYSLLKPCKCGSKNLLIRRDDCDMYYVHCYSCKKETPDSYKSMLDAVLNWNEEQKDGR